VPFAAGIEVARESPAWAAHRTPRVTALTAWRGDCPELTVTLDSLARGRLRDFELVIVGSGPTEQTRASVEDWISEHPRIAACLVLCEKTELGGARNIGLDFARGQSVLVLDPGQTLYPRGLEVLTGTLEAMPDIAFVYPIQEVTGDEDVSSFLGWDPERLRAGNDTHAPALIRTARLRELGGFAADDHDLWRRVADRGWRGQVVPQILARTPAAAAQP
jgi:glycosyltransferase involved in cell wall biosynthesis